MPSARPLLFVSVVLLFGCTPSVRSSFAAPVDSSDADLAEAEASCLGRQTKGIAEVVAMDTTRVWLRFYPGDQLFEHPRGEGALFGVRMGEEFRAIRGDNCGRLSFKIVDENLIDSGVEWAGWREV